MTFKQITALALLSLLCGVACQTTPAPTPQETPVAQGPPVEVRVIAFNDLHGHMEGPSGKVKVAGERVEAGGLDVLGTHLAKLRAQREHTAFVCAGDLVGASPLISALFHDEPTVEAMNLLQMDAVAVGNHEFDEGVTELMRLQQGGCHPKEGCVGKEKFEGAKFPFLAANVVKRGTDTPIFPAYMIKEYDGVKVGFIGLTFKDTPSAVSPDGVKDVEFQDEVTTINSNVKLLQEQGVEAIVVVIHEGAFPQEKYDDVNECPGVMGPVVQINKRLDPAVDAVVAGHTHQAFNCVLEGRPVTSAKSYGRLLSVIDLKIDRATGDVVESKAKNVPITRDVELDPAMTTHVERYRKLVGPLATKQVTLVETDLFRKADEAGNSPLGQLIADAQLAATKKPEAGGANFALMNTGGVRSDIVAKASSEEGDGVVTYEEMQRVQPFGNTLVVLQMTGAQIKALLESQWREDRAVMLQPSKGLTYTWKASGKRGDRIDPKSIKLNGAPLNLGGSYRVTVNSFLASGGDGFALFKEAKKVTGGPVDLDAFVVFAQANTPLKVSGPRIKMK